MLVQFISACHNKITATISSTNLQDNHNMLLTMRSLLLLIFIALVNFALTEPKPCSTSDGIFEAHVNCTSYNNADREQLRQTIRDDLTCISGNASALELDARSQPEFTNLLPVSR